ncbi:MAG: hypothetical protein ACW98X_25070 [Promethearchaeota archaeon]
MSEDNLEVRGTYIDPASACIFFIIDKRSLSISIFFARAAVPTLFVMTISLSNSLFLASRSPILFSVSSFSASKRSCRILNCN